MSVKNPTISVDGFYKGLNAAQKKMFLRLLESDNMEHLERFRDKTLNDYSETVNKVISIVEEVWQFKAGTLKKFSRLQERVFARSQYYKVMSLFTVCSYEYFAGQVGKDHSTVCHALNTGWEVYKTQKGFIDKWQKVKARCMEEVFNQTEINQNQ